MGGVMTAGCSHTDMLAFTFQMECEREDDDVYTERKIPE